MKYFLYHPVQYSTPSQPSIKNVLLSFCSRLRDEKTTIFLLLAQKLPHPVEFKFDRCMLHPCNEVISKQTPNSVFLANFRHLDGQEKQRRKEKERESVEENRGWSRGQLDPEVLPPFLGRQRATKARNQVEEERGWFRVPLFHGRFPTNVIKGRKKEFFPRCIFSVFFAPRGGADPRRAFSLFYRRNL